MSLSTCADCSTLYAADIAACPHCGSGDVVEEGVTTKRLPLFLTVSCPACSRGPWTVRLELVTSGLVSLPTLACASCGSRVPVAWPPEEEPMSPKITVHGGATNAHGADVSPADDVSSPQVVAEDGLGHPAPEMIESIPDEVLPDLPADAYAEDAVPLGEEGGQSYEGMTLAELRAEAEKREVPSYGTKAQITERLRESDAAAENESQQ